MLIAFEGLDQSGKETQARMLAEHLRGLGRPVEALSFPDYGTPIGREIGAALAGGRDFGPDVMQLLYVANRYEFKPRILESLGVGTTVVCDRYLASSIAYGEAQGLDASWLAAVQQFLPQPDFTVVLDIAPETAVARKQRNRDRYERDMALLTRARASYQRQARQSGWVLVNGERPKDVIGAEILAALASTAARKP